MSGARHRRVGNACEREVVDRHHDLGIKAERYPLSGSSRFRGSGHDVDIYAFGTDEAPLVAEVKKRKGGAGFTQLERWLGDYDLLVLRRNHADPMVVLPWRVWARLLERVRRWATSRTSRSTATRSSARKKYRRGGLRKWFRFIALAVPPTATLFKP